MTPKRPPEQLAARTHRGPHALEGQLAYPPGDEALRAQLAQTVRLIRDNVSASVRLLHALFKQQPNLVSVAPAANTSAAAKFEGRWTLLGAVPSVDQLDALVHWLESSSKGNEIFFCDELAFIYPPAADFAHLVRALLGAKLPNGKKDYLLWFRPEKPFLAAEVEAAEAVRKLVIEADLVRQLAGERRARAGLELQRGRLKLLAECSNILMGTMDLEECLRDFADHLSANFCDVCVIYRHKVPRSGDDAGARAGPATWKRTVLSHKTSQGQNILNELANFPELFGVAGSPLQLDRLAGGVLQSRVTEEWLAQVAPSQSYQHFLRKELGVQSIIVAPMRSHGRLLGCLKFIRSGTVNRFGADDLAFAEEVGRRAAHAVENMSLYAEANDAVRAREQVLSVVSHDLRNPIAAITLTTDSIERKLKKATSGEVLGLSAALERIRASSRRMLALIEDLLSSAKIDGGTLVLHPERVAARDIVGEVVALAEPIAQAKGVRVAVELDADAELSCDRNRLLQVFSNLVGNAIKFTPAGGTVRVQVAQAGADQVVFDVSDTGPGIAAEDLPHIFERYWQANETASQGTGLGLFIAQTIVHAHHGTIAVHNGARGGASFRVALPREQNRQAGKNA